MARVPLTRVRLIVALAAAAAAAATVGVVVLTADDPVASAGEPPPLVFEPAGALDGDVAAGAELYRAGRLEEACARFDRARSAEARVGSAFCRWPEETLDRLDSIAGEPVGRLHIAIVKAALGDEAEARRVLRTVEPLDRDSPYAVRAEDLLHPDYVPGVPVFVPARTRLPRDLERSLRLLRAGHRVSARRVLARVVARSPDDPALLTAAAVAAFDKDRPATAFSRLGPLTRRFPRAQVVRFHLGLLLLWIGAADEAQVQLQRARAIEPRSQYGRDAKRFLDRLESGTS
jgi:tetratricopeptide (TPR) repeat protein